MKILMNYNDNTKIVRRSNKVFEINGITGYTRHKDMSICRSKNQYCIPHPITNSVNQSMTPPSIWLLLRRQHNPLFKIYKSHFREDESHSLASIQSGHPNVFTNQNPPYKLTRIRDVKVLVGGIKTLHKNKMYKTLRHAFSDWPWLAVSIGTYRRRQTTITYTWIPQQPADKKIARILHLHSLPIRDDKHKSPFLVRWG